MEQIKPSISGKFRGESTIRGGVLVSLVQSPIFRIILIWKITIFSIAVVLVCVGPGVSQSSFDTYISWPPGPTPTWQTSLAAWDASHYLHLATVGYVDDEPSCAFYPMWPLTLRSFSYVSGVSPFWIGLVLANTISMIGVFYFYRLTKELSSELLAQKATILLLCLPGSIYLSLIYTEPLFFALSIGVCYLLQKDRFIPACIISTFLPLTRPVGIFILIPLIFHSWHYRKDLGSKVILTACPMIGYAAYFGAMYLWTGNPFEGFEAQKHFPTTPAISRIWDIGGFFQSFLTISAFHNAAGSMLDRWFFVLFVILVVGAIRKYKSLGTYALLVGLISVVPTRFISFTRHFVMCFPIIWALAQFFPQNQKRFSFYAVCSVCACLQLFLWFRYTSFKWAG